MALTDDQRAMLRLLARREEGYEDIAALMGISVEEVRARVRDALAGLDETAGAPTQPPPPSPPADPEPHAVAPKPQAKPRAEPPRAGATPPADPPPATTTSRPRPSLPRLRLPHDRRRLAEVVGAALIALLVVLFASGAIDIGGGDDSGSRSGGGEDGVPQLTGAEEEKLTRAQLQAVGGGDASGQAIFGRVGKDEVVLQVTAENLEPTPKGEAYTVWLFQSPKLALRVGSVNVGEAGELGARFPIPAELLGYVASGAFPQIHVTRTENAAYQREVAQAEKQKRLPRYSGETVLRGKITGPIVQQSAQG